jgi:hypothetical protein
VGCSANMLLFNPSLSKKDAWRERRGGCSCTWHADAGVRPPDVHWGVQEIMDAEDYLDALNLDTQEVRWALGQAVSRAFGDTPMLIPAVDCVNHSNCTSPPITCDFEMPTQQYSAAIDSA